MDLSAPTMFAGLVDIVATDDEMDAVRWSSDVQQWEPLPPLPLRFAECLPAPIGRQTTGAFQLCPGIALRHHDQWVIVPLSGNESELTSPATRYSPGGAPNSSISAPRPDRGSTGPIAEADPKTITTSDGLRIVSDEDRVDIAEITCNDLADSEGWPITAGEPIGGLRVFRLSRRCAGQKTSCPSRPWSPTNRSPSDDVGNKDATTTRSLAPPTAHSK